MSLFITEEEVARLLTMDVALEVVEEVFRQEAAGLAVNRPRQRVRTGTGALHVMVGSAVPFGALGLKAYTTFPPPSGARFVVLLYDAHAGDLIAVVQADKLGQMRTGAVSGVATKYMARADADQVGIFGTGWQARSQLQAVCAVRSIRLVRAYSRDPQRRADFCQEMSALLGLAVEPVESPEEALRGADVVITATTSAQPVFDGQLLEPGTHVNAMGSNSLLRREIDETTVRRASLIVVDSVEQAKIESGDLLGPIEKGIASWEQIRELRQVVAGEVPGRQNPDEITLFDSHGLAIEDVAVAARVYELARGQGAGRQIPV